MTAQRTALVLSAGGLFGAWQAGAWKHLAQVIEPDMIIGASVGALNGWCTASQWSPCEMSEIWLDPQLAGTAPQDRPGIFRGYYDPEPLRRTVGVLWSGRRPTIPFYLVTVELPLCRSRIISSENLTSDHLVATCSIPILFPPVRISGRIHVDGGVFGQLPLWAAAELGATRIIALDCLPKISPWWVQATMSSLHLLSPTRKLPKEIHTLRPSGYMGTAHHAIEYDPDRIRRWLQMGEKDAQTALPESLIRLQ